VNTIKTDENISLGKTSTHTVKLKNTKSKKNIAVVNRIFAPEGKESLNKILENLIRDSL